MDYLLNLIDRIIALDKDVSFWQIKRVLEKGKVNLDKKVLVTRLRALSGLKTRERNSL